MTTDDDDGRYREFDRAAAARLQPHQRALAHPGSSWKDGDRWTLRTADGTVLHEDPLPAPPPPRYAPVRRAAAPAPAPEAARVDRLVTRLDALERRLEQLETTEQAQRAVLEQLARAAQALDRRARKQLGDDT